MNGLADYHRIEGRLPWGQLPPLDLEPQHPRLIYQAFRGWHQNLWYDGPDFVRRDGVIQKFIMPGSRVPLVLEETRSDHAGLEVWIKEREMFAWKKSLALAFREGLTLDDAAYRLGELVADPSHALVLLGLRLAFPRTVFFALDYPADHKPQWKRYAQNLNISTWAAPSELKDLPQISINELSRPWPEASARRFWSAFKVPVLPGKLAQLFTH